MNHLDESYSGATPDILDNAYVTLQFGRGARAVLELCMFAECSKHQEELSLVGPRGKLEAFAPSHGARTDDPSLINYRRGVRNVELVSGWGGRTEPPPPEQCGELTEEHVSVDPELLLAGNHAGATHEELVRFVAAVADGAPPAVSLADGSKAVLMGIAAQRSIARGGAPVAWSEMTDEFEAALEAARAELAADSG